MPVAKKVYVAGEAGRKHCRRFFLLRDMVFLVAAAGLMTLVPSVDSAGLSAQGAAPAPAPALDALEALARVQVADIVATHVPANMSYPQSRILGSPASSD